MLQGVSAAGAPGSAEVNDLGVGADVDLRIPENRGRYGKRYRKPSK